MKQLSGLITTIFLIPIIVTAQDNAIIYPTLTDYIAQNHMTADIIIEQRSSGSIAMVGGCDYKIYSEDGKLSKELKNNYIAVQRNDSLFINCHDIIRSKWYGLAFYTTKDYIFFTASTSGQKKHQIDMKQVDPAYGMMFGAVGAGIAGAENAKLRYNYVLDLATGEVYVLNIRSMQMVLKNHPDVDMEYTAEGHPTDLPSLLRLLRKAFD
jgi:hypothetical protein